MVRRFNADSYTMDVIESLWAAKILARQAACPSGVSGYFQCGTQRRRILGGKTFERQSLGSGKEKPTQSKHKTTRGGSFQSRVTMQNRGGMVKEVCVGFGLRERLHGADVTQSCATQSRGGPTCVTLGVARRQLGSSPSPVVGPCRYWYLRWAAIERPIC